MLVLSRRVGKGVVLPGCQVKVKVLDVRGQQVRLGFEAPAEVAVYRDEVWSRILDQPSTEFQPEVSTRHATQSPK